MNTELLEALEILEREKDISSPPLVSLVQANLNLTER